MNVKKLLVMMAAVSGTLVLCQCSSEAPPPPGTVRMVDQQAIALMQEARAKEAKNDLSGAIKKYKRVRPEKREEFDDRKIDSQRGKLGVQDGQPGQNIDQSDLLLGQEVRQQQDLVDISDQDPQVGQDRDRDAVALYDAQGRIG